MNRLLENTKSDQVLSKNFYYFFAALLILGILFSYLISMRFEVALIATAIIALLIIFYQRTDIGLNITTTAILAGQLVKIPLGEEGGGSGIILTDLLVPLLVVTWLTKKIINGEKIIKKSAITPYLIIFLGLALASFAGGLWFLESPSQALISLLYSVRLISYSFLYFVGLDVFRQDTKVRSFKITLLITFLLFALLGILQLEYFPKLGFLSIINQGWDPHVRRLFSTFLDPNFAGAFLSIGAIFVLSLLFYVRNMEKKLILIALFIIQLYALVLTYSRSSYLLFTVSLIVFALMRSKKLLIFLLVAIIITFTQYPRAFERIQDITNFEQTDESANQRLISWERSFEVIQDYLIFGIGYNTYRFAQIKYGFIEDEETTSLSGAGSDSSLLTILVTTGSIGLISFLLFYLASIKQAWVLCKKHLAPDRNAFGFTLFAVLIGLFLHSIFVNSLLYPYTMIILFAFLSITAFKSKTEFK